MTTAVVDRSRVLKIHSWCRDAFRSVGHSFDFPKNTDPTKTYQWRYLESLVAKLEMHGLDDQASRFVIQKIAEYAKTHKLLHKGYAVYLQGNVLEICLKEAESHERRCDGVIAGLQECRQRILSLGAPKVVEKRLQIRETLDHDERIVEWYQSGMLSITYIAFSAVCRTVLSKLPPESLRRLPTMAQLYAARLKTLNQIGSTKPLQQVMKEDFRL